MIKSTRKAVERGDISDRIYRGTCPKIRTPISETVPFINAKQVINQRERLSNGVIFWIGHTGELVPKIKIPISETVPLINAKTVCFKVIK